MSNQHIDSITADSYAIVGLSCRLPGAKDKHEFWRLLTEASEHMRDTPEWRWSAKNYESSDASNVPGLMSSSRGGYIPEDQIKGFDCNVLGVSQKEVEVMDPQQRLLLELTWECLEDAGIRPKKDTTNSKLFDETGVFIGIGQLDFYSVQLDNNNFERITSYTHNGNTLSIASNRISFLYDFRGPSMSIDTACSSSLVAVHQACQSLKNNECEMAIAGGVSLILSPAPYVEFSKVGVLSKDGKCKPFDESANGFVRGEGAGLVVLKPLKKAIESGDYIYGVIRGSSVNVDGAAEDSLITPSSITQSLNMKKAYERLPSETAQFLSPYEVDYVECHGTGTAKGDVVETVAIGEVFSGAERTKPLYVGSVKGNIGHLECASGVAGLIKAVLMMENRLLCPTINVKKLNPKIPLEKYNMRVVTEPVPLVKKNGSKPLLFGVNSMGIGGVNAHVILQEYEKKTQKEQTTVTATPEKKLLMLSAQTIPSLQRFAQELTSKESLYDEQSLVNVCTVQNQFRAHHKLRTCLITSSVDDCLRQLKTLATETPDALKQKGLVTNTNRSDKGLIFVFPGQGPQTKSMGIMLYNKYEEFRKVLDECDALFSKLAGWSLVGKWIKEQSLSDEDMDHPKYAQPSIFFLQAGLFALLKLWDIQPSVVIGHSAGEVGSAYAAGVYTLEEAITILYWRSTLQEKTCGSGNMLAVGVSPAECEKFLDEYLENPTDRSAVVVAAINGPSSCTLAGSPELINKLEKDISKGKGVFCRKLRGYCAFHSQYQEPIKEEMFNALKDFTPKSLGKPTLFPLYSTVTGKMYDTTVENMDVNYLWGNVRQAVLFSEPITELLKQGYKGFVEISPHPVLAASIKECAQDLGLEDIKCFLTLKRGVDEQDTMLGCVKDLFLNGFVHNATFTQNVKWNELFGKVKVPHYPWDRSQLIWNQTEEQAAEWRRGYPTNLVGHKSLRTGSVTFQNRISLDHFPNLKDHVIQGDIIYPGVSYVLMSLHAAVAQIRANEKDSEQKELAKQFILQHCDFKDALSLSQTTNGGFIVETDVTPLNQSTQNSQMIEIRSKRGLEEWSNHYKCFLRILPPTNLKSHPDLNEAKTRCMEVSMSKTELYSKLRKMGLEYGPLFQQLDKIYVGKGEGVTELSLKKNLSSVNSTDSHVKKSILDLKREKSVLEVGILDSCLQSLIAIAEEDSIVYIPASIETCVLNTDVCLNQKVPDMDSISVYCKLTNQSQYELEGDVFIYGHKAGSPDVPIASFLCVKCRAITQPSCPTLFTITSNDCLYNVEWNTVSKEALEKIFTAPDEASPAEEEIPRWLVVSELSDEDDVTKAVVASLEDLNVTVVNGEQALNMLKEKEHIEGIVFVSNATESNQVAQEPNTWLLMKIIKELVNIELDIGECNTKLWIVTKGAQLSYTRPTTAQFIGVGRTFRSEHPNILSFMLDFDETLKLNDTSVVALCGKLFRSASSLEYNELAMTSDGTLKYLKVVKPTQLPKPNAPVTLKSNSIGSVSELTFQEVEEFVPLEPDEVRIQVKASALSFKDLMFALGRIPDKAFRRGGKWNPPFGLECSGVVVELGSQVALGGAFSIGDDVVCIARKCFSSYVNVKVQLIAKKPSWMTYEQASTIPSAFLTSWYSLIHVARLKKGETCLIHSAAGAVGLSAVQIANHVGAVTIGTVGRGEKRTFLETDATYKVTYTTDSRSTQFRDDVMKFTNGKGCDVILNSLAGTDMLSANFESLGPYGRFVEIGIRDIYDGTCVNLQQMHRNLSYSSVDLDRMMDEKPELVQQMFKEVMDLMEQKRLFPLPLVVYDKEKLHDAFNFMAHAKHIGKIVLNMTNEDLSTAIQRYQKLKEEMKGLTFSADKTHLVVGGSRGVGLSLVLWLLEQKQVKNLVILSRSGKLTDGVSKDRIEELLKQDSSIRLYVLACDVSNKQQVQQVVTRIRSELNFPPLESVFHLATVYEDASINNMTEDKFNSVINAKAVSAWNIHEATLSESSTLNYFVMFSSFVAINGNMEQSNYAAANCVLDALAHYRKSILNLPALSVNFGAIDDGFVSRKYSTKVILRSRGFISMPIPLLVKCLEKALIEQEQNKNNSSAQKIISCIDWKDHSDNFKHLKQMFGELFVESANKDAALDAATSQLSVDQMIATQLAKILGVPLESIEITEPLRQYGMDSLMATQLKNWLDKTYPRGSITTIDILKKDTTVKSLAAKISEKMSDQTSLNNSKKDTTKKSEAVAKKPNSSATTTTATSVPTTTQEKPPVSQTIATTTSPSSNKPATPAIASSPAQKTLSPPSRGSVESVEKISTTDDLTTKVATTTVGPVKDFMTHARTANMKNASNSFILGMGTANPPRKSQEELFQGIMKDYNTADEKIRERIHNLFNGCEIKERCVAFDFTKYSTNDLKTIESRNELFHRIAPELAYQAASKALEEWKGDAKEITHLITCTSTGIAVPNIHLKFMDRLGLSRSVEYFPINMSGCAAGLITLKTARALNALNPSKNRVLIICIELSSVHFRISNNTDEKIVSAIFGDGVAAMVVGAQPNTPKGEKPIYELFETHSYTTPNTEECMTWRVFNDGFHLSLSPEVPQIINNSLKDYVNTLIRKSQHKDEIALKQNCNVLAHPGGKAILYAVEKALEMSKDELHASWEIMSKYGNMSSVTILFVMEYYRRTQQYLNNEWALAVAFGPGVATESIILRNTCGGASTLL
nr:unnamed protein product [Naegleria fowleri]